MPTTYSPKGSSIKPYSLTEDDHRGIGRLVRACAEIEDIINLYLCQLADIPEGMAILLLGRLPTSARLKLIEALATANGDKHRQLYREAFDNDHYRAIVKCRNTVAHGQLLGLTDAGEIAFQTHETQGIDDIKLYTTVVAFIPGTFSGLADKAEAIIPQMEEEFGLKALRETRRTPTLSPHTKSQGKGKQKAKRGHQPPPSQEK